MGSKPWLKWSIVALSGLAVVGCQNSPSRTGSFVSSPLASGSSGAPSPRFPAGNVASTGNPSTQFTQGTTVPATGGQFPTTVTPGSRPAANVVTPANSFGASPSSLSSPGTFNLPSGPQSSTARPSTTDVFAASPAPTISVPGGTTRPPFPAPPTAPTVPTAPVAPGMPTPTMPTGFVSQPGQ